jgi:uncharacterized protein HemX
MLGRIWENMELTLQHEIVVAVIAALATVITGYLTYRVGRYQIIKRTEIDARKNEADAHTATEVAQAELRRDMMARIDQLQRHIDALEARVSAKDLRIITLEARVDELEGERDKWKDENARLRAQLARICQERGEKGAS